MTLKFLWLWGKLYQKNSEFIQFFNKGGGSNNICIYCCLLTYVKEVFVQKHVKNIFFKSNLMTFDKFLPCLALYPYFILSWIIDYCRLDAPTLCTFVFIFAFGHNVHVKKKHIGVPMSEGFEGTEGKIRIFLSLVGNLRAYFGPE